MSGKMHELMKLFASKSASIDPNDMPLSTLIENNNESMDVNFVSRNLLDSAAGGTFMEITLGEDYSQWHTERSSTSKKKCMQLKRLMF